MRFIRRVLQQRLTANSQRASGNSFRPYDQTRPVMFMHVPKTSGMAIMAGLTSALTPSMVVGGFDRCCFGMLADLDSMDHSVRCTIYQSDCLPRHADLVAGHFAYSTLQKTYPMAQRLTLLREPYSRLLSHWLFWRQHTDAQLAPWGNWAEKVKKSRQPLVDFLDDSTLACQIDNLALRMLLWPHRLLPEDGFIDTANDARLLREAMVRLNTFDFVDIIENKSLHERLQSWLGRSFSYARINETQLIPPEFRTPLADELTPQAFALLEHRSRLDLRLWAEIAQRRLPGRDISMLRQQTTLKNVARYGILMAR